MYIRTYVFNANKTVNQEKMSSLYLNICLSMHVHMYLYLCTFLFYFQLTQIYFFERWKTDRLLWVVWDGWMDGWLQHFLSLSLFASYFLFFSFLLKRSSYIYLTWSYVYICVSWVYFTISSSVCYAFSHFFVVLLSCCFYFVEVTAPL